MDAGTALPPAPRALMTMTCKLDVLGRNLHCADSWNYKMMLASKCNRVTAEDMLRLLPQAELWKGAGWINAKDTGRVHGHFST